MKTLAFIVAISSLTILSVFGQTEQEINLKTPTSEIFGTLLMPDTSSKTVALIIAGSGPTDRNGNNKLAGDNNSLKLIAEGLAEKGIASLRYDKRGIGASKEAAIPENKIVFENFVEDAVDWIEALKQDKRFSKYVIVGHSEGSLIAIIAANRSKVDAVVSISGAGFTADSILRKQLEKQPDQLKNEAYRILDSLKNGIELEDINPFLYALFRPSIQPYLINWFKFSPALEINKLDIPVLIVNGTTDMQVSVDNAENLHKAAKYSDLLILENMNHILKTSSDDFQENYATYSNPALPLHPELMKGIVDFLNSKIN